MLDRRTVAKRFYTLIWASTLCVALRADAATPLRDLFDAPPESARPYAWWHWMGPNISEEGITLDLEAMKASGIGGATIFNITSAVQESHAPTLNNPWPERTYRSDAYWRAVRHAASKAERLGLEVGLHNTVGYSTTGGPWIDEPRSMQQLVWSKSTVAGGQNVEMQLPAPELGVDSGWGKTGRKITQFTDVAVVAVPAGVSPIPAKSVLELTTRMNADGRLLWDAPAGEWTVFRFAHASTGRAPHPVPDELIGRALEADKMSLEQTRFHWNTVIDPLREHLGPLVGRSFKHLLIDSYEAGPQNWTIGLREEFQRRKGYDPVPWLVAMPEVVTNDKKIAVTPVGDADQTARFAWDLRDVIESMYYENGWKPAAEMIHAAGCELQFEAYGGPFSTIDGSALADVPMTEFWAGGNSPSKIPVAAAHAAGRRIIAAEAFTGYPTRSQWTETPSFLRTSADRALAAGVNRMVLHTWVHQPFDDRYKPGFGMGWWGTHFGRNQTWFEPGKAFFLYLRRCQALLQWGEPCADFVSVGKQQARADLISWRTLRSGVHVRDGRIVLESGRTYAFLSIPDAKAMRPQDVELLSGLLRDGATIVCERPIRSPSLEGYPDCDRQVRERADNLWGDQPVMRHGAGTLYTAGDPAAALRDLAPSPALALSDADAKDTLWIRRSDGKSDVFFVVNAAKQARRIVVSIEGDTRSPALWDAELGTAVPAPIWRANGGRTDVELFLDAGKSIFLVFDAPLDPKQDHVIAVDGAEAFLKVGVDNEGRPTFESPRPIDVTLRYSSGKSEAIHVLPPKSIDISGPWDVELHSPVDTDRSLHMPKLISLSESSEPAVRYFSGTATYRTTFDGAALPTAQRVVLDLGDVADMASVGVNGHDLGVWWHAPFQRDISTLVKPGPNELVVKVTNTWHNRLVGDEQEPVDVEWGPPREGGKGRGLKAYPDWFVRDQPRPSSGRKCFVMWNYFDRDTPLRPAGLLGPVTLRVSARD